MPEPYALRLYTAGLGSKFGFSDGDLPEALLDWCDEQGVPYPAEWRPILCRLVREYLLPALDRPVEVSELVTNHNPIRAVCPEDLEGVSPEYVEVTWEQIQAAALVCHITRRVHP